MELNRKLAEWAGFKQLPKGNEGFHYEFTKKVMNWMPPDKTAWFYSVTHVPNFTESLDLCLKWLVPKLSYWTISQEVNTRAGASVQTFDYKRSGVVFGETPALSFCLAIEKLIDGGGDEK